MARNLCFSAEGTGTVVRGAAIAYSPVAMESKLSARTDGSAAAPITGATIPACPLTPRWKQFSKRVIQVGFFFFLIKGIAWLVVGFIAWRGLT